MKLEEIVDSVFTDRDQINKMTGNGVIDKMLSVSFNQDALNPDELELIKDQLIECDIFSDCDDLEIVKYPAFKIGEDKTVTVQSIKYADGMKFKGKCYLYSISRTPKMYDPSDLSKPVKDGASISPPVYSPTTFEPQKIITLRFNPDGLMDDETKKQEIRDLLDKVLENPEEYEIPGKRGILIRGVFEQVNNHINYKPSYLVGKVSEELPYYIAYYLESDENNDQEGKTVTMRMKQKVIPKELKEKFIEKFTEDGKIKVLKKEEIDQFLEENNKEDMSEKLKNEVKDPLPEIEFEIQKEEEPQNQLEELNDYLIMLSEMDKIGIRRKVVLLESYIHMLKNKINKK